MNITKTAHFTERKDWRNWLKKNHSIEKEIWVIYYRKATGKKNISYNDVVEEALCFGWIDSTVKSVDSEKCAQRMTPRRKISVLSEANKERIRRMIAAKKMTAVGMKAVAHAFDPNEKFVIAPDILRAIKSNKEVWQNFQKFSESYKRVRIGYLEDQRKHSSDAFERSLRNFLKKTEQNKLFGMIQ